MTEGETGIAVLLATSIAVSVVVHRLDRNRPRATLVSAAVATIIFQVLAYLHAGYLDPFFIIALFLGGAISLGIAAVVGVLFLRYRARGG